MNNRLIAVAVTVVGLSGCVNDTPLVVENIFSLDPGAKGECAFSATVGQTGGSLDLSGSNRYLIRMDLKNFLAGTALDTTAGGQILETGEHRNSITINEVVLNYAIPLSTGLKFPEESEPVAFVVKPGEVSKLGTDILGEKAVKLLTAEFDKDDLAAAAARGNDAGYFDGGFFVGESGVTKDLRVKVEFRGALNAGGRINSLPLTFPITVYRSGFTYAAQCSADAGDQIAHNGPCGGSGGQDNSRICCTPSDKGCPVIAPP